MNNLQTSNRANFKVLSEGELTRVVGGHDHNHKRGGHYEERNRKNDKNDKHGKQRPPQIPFPILL